MNKSNNSLFRKESIENNKSQFIGQIILINPYRISIILLIFVLIFIAIVFIFTYFDYGRKIIVKGSLLPTDGIVTILPTESSIVDRILVKDGQLIKKGQPLFILRNLKSTVTYDSIEKYLYDKKENLIHEHNVAQEQNKTKASSLEHIIKNYNEEKSVLITQISAQKERVAIATNILDKYQKLISNNAISIVEFNNKQSELLDQKSILFSLEQKFASINRDIQNSEIELIQIPLTEEKENTTFKQNLSLVEKELIENEAQKLTTISSPKDGVIANIIVSEGQSVEENALITSILPINPILEANLFIPSSAIGFIKVGLPVSIRYDAFPYQKFGQHKGFIKEISNNTIHTNDLQLLSINYKQINNETDAYYRVKVELDNQNVLAYGRNYPLKVGMSFESNIVLDKRKIYEWIFEPLFSINGDL